MDGSRLVMLAKTREGYANISRLFTLANAEDRRKPRLDPALLREYAGGVVLLTGGRGGPLARLLSGGRREDARALLSGLPGVVRLGIGVRGAAAEPAPGGHGA